MATTVYHLHVSQTATVQTFSKKASAIKAGEETGRSFDVKTGTGTVVHEFTAPTTGNPADTTKEITTMTDAPATGKVPLKDAVANAKAAAADKAKDKPASAAKPKAAPAPKPKYVEKTVLAFNDKWTADDKTAVKTFAKDNAVDGMVEAPNGTYIRLCAGQTTVGWLNKNRIDLPGGKKVHLSTGRAPK